MTCSRCCGLMIETQVLDMEGAYGEMWVTSRRCVNCGYVHDAVIEQHRRPNSITSWWLPVESWTIRRTKSILQRSLLSCEQTDVTTIQPERTYLNRGCTDADETNTENTDVSAIDGKPRLSR